MLNKGLFTSKTPEWETPQKFFDELNKEFHFTLDVCATKQNAKCKKYYSEKDDGLKKGWYGNVWCNPPYGREIGKWVEKAFLETHKGIIVMLLPARTDTKYFHEYIYKKPWSEIRFIKGRLKFGNSTNSAPFPSMIVIFK
jgi:site-specific DNA-methyltransferase (adenine-specific)